MNTDKWLEPGKANLQTIYILYLVSALVGSSGRHGVRRWHPEECSIWRAECYPNFHELAGQKGLSGRWPFYCGALSSPRGFPCAIAAVAAAERAAGSRMAAVLSPERLSADGST